MEKKIEEAKRLRENKQPEEAMRLLETLLQSHPNDPDLNYQMAWTCDSMGKESAAAPYYEKAIANGLTEDRKGCFLGLGSTYRCLGAYQKSLDVFDQALKEFPEERSFKVFRALTLYNLGKAEESVRELLLQLIDTTTDDSIKSYDKALRFYSDKLNQTWT
ncbi:MAG: tetratricopeptide repeat protein [Bdellovibrionaceae bacterium]|nr:tetratricopeptide repeat protein [Pseudobdellovibrionaceae bacterium]